ncbi:acetyltransferase [Deinococcus psychrotolerans]|uniref:Acetyltransferase n=1 Tax=Deinococcus psychrotolerans TaxID=2489213 RepID=A0A3G8YHT2_9DEIO|nr:acetyltransferase [Deinococcus psychrotolerans]
MIVRKQRGFQNGFLLGAGTSWLTGPYVEVGHNLRVGKRCRIETISEHNGLSYFPRLTFGNNVSLNDDVHIACVSRVEIGNNVLMASKIYISDHNHGSYSGEHQDSPVLAPGERHLGYAPVVIEDNVWLGELVSVLPGVTIGEGSIIGANSVVSRNIPPYCIAVGTPACVIKRYDFKFAQWIHESSAVAKHSGEVI